MNDLIDLSHTFIKSEDITPKTKLARSPSIDEQQTKGDNSRTSSSINDNQIPSDFSGSPISGFYEQSEPSISGLSSDVSVIGLDYNQIERHAPSPPTVEDDINRSSSSPRLSSPTPDVRSSSSPRLSSPTPDVISSSSPRLSSPPVDTSGPPVDTSGPPVDTSGPTVDTSGPTVDTSGPTVDTSGPTVDTSSPPVDTSGPKDRRTSDSKSKHGVKDAKNKSRKRRYKVYRPEYENMSDKERRAASSKLTYMIKAATSCGYDIDIDINYDEDCEPEYLHEIYADVMDETMSRNYGSYVLVGSVMFWTAYEHVLTQYLGLDVRGLSDIQIKLFPYYHGLMRELIDRWTKGKGDGISKARKWSPEKKLFVLIVGSTVATVILNYVLTKIEGFGGLAKTIANKTRNSTDSIACHLASSFIDPVESKKKIKITERNATDNIEKPADANELVNHYDDIVKIKRKYDSDGLSGIVKSMFGRKSNSKKKQANDKRPKDRFKPST